VAVSDSDSPTESAPGTRLNVVVICEESGIVREAFRRRGHYAISVDLQPSAQPGPHHQGDALEFLFRHAKEFDLIDRASILHLHSSQWQPALCEYTVSQIRRCVCRSYLASTDPQAMPGASRQRPATQGDIDVTPQYIQPWQFGHGEIKRTALFLSGLPPLMPTNIVDGRQARVWMMPPGSGLEQISDSTHIDMSYLRRMIVDLIRRNFITSTNGQYRLQPGARDAIR
jgi:hypothetical protein